MFKDATGLKPDDVGVGLVGSLTFCLFTYEVEQLPPEDGCTIHRYWEMTNRGLITKADVQENSTEYDQMWQQCKLDGLGSGGIILVVERSEKSTP